MKKIYAITLHTDSLDRTDESLGELCREKLLYEAVRHEEALLYGRQSARNKLGHKIEIDGVVYPSRKVARMALGINYAKFAKLYPNTHKSEA